MPNPKEQQKYFKARFSALKKSRRFISWGESAGLSRELREILQQIEDQVEDPQTGCELVASFFTTDYETAMPRTLSISKHERQLNLPMCGSHIFCQS